MKPRAMLSSAVFAVLLIAGQVHAADAPSTTAVKDPAELLPEQTLFYIELWDNPQLMKELQDLLKGSSLEDLPAAIARFHEKLGTKDHDFNVTGVAGAGVCLSPEMLGEIGRVRGWSFAVTKLDNKMNPVWVSVLLTGDSEVVPLAFRAYLSMTEGIRSVGEANGVKIYQDKSAKKAPPGKGSAAAPLATPAVPLDVLNNAQVCMAMAPGMVVFGSSPDSVKDVLTRAKDKGASLARSKGFQTAAKLRENGGGLFFYADLDRVAKMLDQLPPEGNAADWQNTVKAFVNPKAFHAIAGSLMLRKGGIDVSVQLNVDVKDAGPLVELLSDKPANLELLHYLPSDSLFASVIPVTEGDKKWQKMLTMANAVAKASGQQGQPLPGEQVDQFEKNTNINVGKDICAKIAGIAVGMSASNPKGADGEPFPVFVIEATSEDAAASLEDLIPKVVGFFLHKGILFSEEEVNGVKVKSLTDDNFPWHGPLSYGHRGKLLVVSSDPKAVADSIKQGGDKKGLLAQPKVAAAVKEFDKPVAASLWMMGDTIRFGMAQANKGGTKADDPFDKEMAKVVEKLPPMIFSLNVKSDHISYEVRQPGLKSVSAKLIDLLIEKGLHESEAGPPKAQKVPPIP